jgi:hypothetical protein
MKGKKIAECGNYAMVRCVSDCSTLGVGSSFKEGEVFAVHNGTTGTYLYKDGHKIHATSARFVEHVEEVQLCEHGVEDDDVLSAPPIKRAKPSPWDGQVGGSHYTDKAVQPLKLTLLNRGYEAFSGACYTKINKYTTRAKDNEVEQLKKARHVLDLWIYEAEKQS